MCGSYNIVNVLKIMLVIINNETSNMNFFMYNDNIYIYLFILLEDYNISHMSIFLKNLIYFLHNEHKYLHNR